ncbi:MAG: NUDIX hydrolase [Streptosporangiaceae bacterium]
MTDIGLPLVRILSRYHPRGPADAAGLARCQDLARTTADPWLRSRPVHFTASAMVVHPPSARVLLRWHERLQAWLQIGGHGDPGETEPIDIALREGREETGLADLAPWPDGALLHVSVLDVPASSDEPAHQHADLRFVLATASPDTASPENPGAPLRWLSLPKAAEIADHGLRETLARLETLLPALSASPVE